MRLWHFAYICLVTLPLRRCSALDGALVAQASEGINDMRDLGEGTSQLEKTKVLEGLAKKSDPSNGFNDLNPGRRYSLPRYAPEGEWRIKTLWIPIWRSISNKLIMAIAYIASGIALPFRSLIKFEGPAYGKTLMRGLGEDRIPVWETIPTKKAGNSESAWKVPEIPPVSSPNPKLLKPYFLLGFDILTERDKDLSNFQAVMTKLATAQGEKRSGINVEELKQLLISDSHVEFIKTYAMERQHLMHYHEEVKKALGDVVNSLGGEENTRTFFRKIIHEYEKVRPTGIVSKPKDTENTGMKQTTSSKMIHPRVDEIHLAPLLLLTKAMENPAPAKLRDETAHQLFQTFLAKFQKPAEFVWKYVEQINQVEEIQNRILELNGHIEFIHNYDFENWPKFVGKFQKIVELDSPHSKH